VEGVEARLSSRGFLGEGEGTERIPGADAVLEAADLAAQAVMA
jgi:hypothetical protein